MAGSTGLPSREEIAQLPVAALVDRLVLALEQIQQLTVHKARSDIQLSWDLWLPRETRPRWTA
jgi:hypothetical protein